MERNQIPTEDIVYTKNEYFWTISKGLKKSLTQHFLNRQPDFSIYYLTFFSKMFIFLFSMPLETMKTFSNFLNTQPILMWKLRDYCKNSTTRSVLDFVVTHTWYTFVSFSTEYLILTIQVVVIQPGWLCNKGAVVFEQEWGKKK